jgi:hypothetical protein
LAGGKMIAQGKQGKKGTVLLNGFYDIKNNIIEDKKGEVVEIRTVPFIS